ncbi:MAG: gamma-glutamyltransferase [Alphaproteobacteria bacterium]|nr:gamma-glutamyltransferase [Alphaproteobacteria bacterium]
MVRRNHIFLSLPGRARGKPGTAGAGAIAAAMAALLALTACEGVKGPGARASADEAGFAPTSQRKPVIARRQMVASANPIASRVGLEILRKGGAAIDAAVAMQMVLTLVEPQSSGIGGSSFLMHFEASSGEIAAFEGRETAARAVKETLFMNPDGTAMARGRYRVGGISVGVPGTLRMLERAQRRHGRLKWRSLFQPAIGLAKRGFKVSKRLHESIARDRYLSQYAAARAYFFDPSGQPLAVGALLKNPALARSLTAISKGGANAFYRGSIAIDVARATRADKRRPGLMKMADLVGYRVKLRPTVCGPYRSWLVCGFGPPTAGGIATVMTLALLERFDLARLRPGSVEAVHLISEATRLVNADRLRYVADPDFVSVPVSGLLDQGYLRRRSEVIRRDRAMKKARPGRIPMLAQSMERAAASVDDEPSSTTHMSVVDAQGNAVAMTSSVGGVFGSRIMVRGFMLNNEATDFSPVPRTRSGRPKVNRPGPGKRPRSSQSPTLVFDGSGRLALALGSPGGTRIIGYVVKTLIGVLDWGLDIQAAISLPNHGVKGGRIDIERGTALEDIAQKLRALGHKVRVRPLTSGIQGIARVDGVLTGGADPRREGLVLGD